MTAALKRVFWISFVLAMSIYAVMVGWSLPEIADAAGGALPFDLRPMGYDLEDARAFLSALGQPGRNFYLTVQHRLDMAYPLLLAIALGSGIALLTPRKLVRWRWFAAAIAVPGMIFDYRENVLVARLLAHSPHSIDGAAVAAASQATLLKSLFTTLAMAVLVVLLIVWFAQARRRHPRGR